MEKPILEGYTYSLKERIKARDSGKLLSIRFDTNLSCNAKCIYCAWESGYGKNDYLDFDILKSIIIESKELGCKSVVIIGGGEPTLYYEFRNLISHIYKQGLIPVLITNGFTMSTDQAKFLKEHNVSISFKFDSFIDHIQDTMVGIPGGMQKQMNCLNNLLEVYNDLNFSISKLAISFVITSLNYNEIEFIWRYCRKRNIIPNINIFNQKGRGIFNKTILEVSQDNLDDLFLKIDKIDIEEYGLFPISPETKIQKCLQHLSSVYIDVDGFVHACPAVRNNKFNINETSLTDIVNSPFFKSIFNKNICLDNTVKPAMVNFN